MTAEYLVYFVETNNYEHSLLHIQHARTHACVCVLARMTQNAQTLVYPLIGDVLNQGWGTLSCWKAALC